jgi:hypothetical protein
MRRFLPRLTYANVIASLALFIALGGAAVAAGLPKGSVGANQLKNGAVSAKAIRAKAVTAGKIAPKAVVAGKLGPNAVLPGNLGAGIIDSSKISAGAVTAEKIKNNVVTGPKINNAAVTSQKIAANGVATINITEGAVTAPKIGKAAITAEKLAPEVLNNVSPLKSGQTQRGIFDVGGSNTTTPAEAVTERGAISFQQALAASPAVNVIKKNGPFTAPCPGLGAGGTTPEAVAGNLCIYLTTETNLDPTATSPIGLESSSRLGTGLVVKSAATKGEFVAGGVWAVTAP